MFWEGESGLKEQQLEFPPLKFTFWSIFAQKVHFLQTGSTVMRFGKVGFCWSDEFWIVNNGVHSGNTISESERRLTLTPTHQSLVRLLMKGIFAYTIWGKALSRPPPPQLSLSLFPTPYPTPPTRQQIGGCNNQETAKYCMQITYK